MTPFTTAPPMTDEQFAELVDDHPDLWFEMTAGGELIVMPPNKTRTGARNADITIDLGVWARNDKRGAGFSTPQQASFYQTEPVVLPTFPGLRTNVFAPSAHRNAKTTSTSAPISSSNSAPNPTDSPPSAPKCANTWKTARSSAG